MTEAEIANEVRRIIAQVAPDVDPATIQAEEDIRRSLGIDSFDHLRILTAASERFNVAIGESDHSRLRSVQDITRFIREHGAQ